jgi:predicted nucleotide-binding protein
VRYEDDMTKGRTFRTRSFSKPRVPKEEAIRTIGEQIEIGRAIRDTNMHSMMDLENAQERRTEWLENNTGILTRFFDDSILEEYNTDISLDINNAITFTLKEKYFKDDINEQIGRLESFLDRMKQKEEPTEEPMRQNPPKEIHPGEAPLRGEPLMEKPPMEKLIKKELSEKLPSPEKPKEETLRRTVHERKPIKEEPPSTGISNQSQLPRSNILLIYDQDEGTKESVLKLIEKLGLRAFTVREEPNAGKTLIEKFGKLCDIHFAIILLTPDGPPQDQPGGRKVWLTQNMIFEFGYFLGKLGPGRVCALYKEGMKIALDDWGVVNIPMDSRGGWRLFIAKEIKQSGIEIDLNKAI